MVHVGKKHKGANWKVSQRIDGRQNGLPAGRWGVFNGAASAGCSQKERQRIEVPG